MMHKGLQLDNVRGIGARRKPKVFEGSGVTEGYTVTKWEPEGPIPLHIVNTGVPMVGTRSMTHYSKPTMQATNEVVLSSTITTPYCPFSSILHCGSLNNRVKYYYLITGPESIIMMENRPYRTRDNMAPFDINAVRTRVLEIISEKTGYPSDMLEVDLDMEADLGIDTVKQVELFSTIREEYGLSSDEGVKLSEYPTIKHVVEYIADGLGIEISASSTEEEVGGTEREDHREAITTDEIFEEIQDARSPEGAGLTRGGVERWIIELMAEKTGYPREMLEPDLDMEADLGIDTVKQVELLGAIREKFGFDDEGVNLSDHPTIARIVDYVAEKVGAAEDTEDINEVTVSSPESVALAGGEGTGQQAANTYAASGIPPSEETLSLPPAELSDYYSASFEPVAVVGMGCVFPDAPDIESFWNNIITKKDSIIEAPPDRWDLDTFYNPDPSIPNKTYSKIGGHVTGYEFDPIPFRIPPKSVERIDPVQLWGLTATKQAWEDAGYHSKEFDPERVAVIMANAQGGEKRDEAAILIHLQQYQKALKDSGALDPLSEQDRKRILDEIEDRICGDMLSINEDSMPGELSNIIPARIANRFNFKGPNFTTDAACASSLAALDVAAKGLQARDFDVVIVGGSDRSMNPVTYVKFCKIGVLSATGSRPFDAGADGFVMGEGAGVMVLKRLSDAMNDGDKIYAVLRGLGGSSDGRAKGITAPNPEGQTLAIKAAYERAGYDPSTVSLVEAHGTSTVVGDAAELHTLTTIWGSDGGGRTPVGIGSIKSQIGHLKSAAGIAGIIKMVLAMHYRTLPPTINYKVPNPKVDLSVSPFFMVTEPTPWDRPEIDGREIPRRGGVSAFGFGGANFHATLEEYTGRYPVDPELIGHAKRTALSKPFPVPEIITTAPGVPTVPANFDLDRYIEEKAYIEGDVLFLAADSGEALGKQVKEVHNELSKKSGGKVFRLAEFVHEINSRSGDGGGGYRLSLAGANAEELASKLDLVQDNIEDPDRMLALEVRGISSSTPETLRELLAEDGGGSRIGFIFPGQGSQYLNMLRDLSQKYRVVAETFEESDRIMTGIIGGPLTDIIFADEGDLDEVVKNKLGQLRRTEITQPAMITGDIALFRLLEQLGVKPDAVAGHSLGEYGALVASGVMDFESALLAASARGREMANIQIDDKGKMASVAAGEEVVQKILDSVDGYAIVANKNSPVESVISGESRAIEEAAEKLGREGINYIMLPVSHAFHSDIVAPAKEPLRRFLSNIPIKAPNIPTLTNVHGGLYPTGPGARDEIIDILVEQVAGAVEWRREMEFMYGELGIRIFLEVGTKRALTITVKNIFKGRSHRAILTNHPKKGGIHTFNEALGALAVSGVPLKWHSPDDRSLYTDEFVAAGAAMRGESTDHVVRVSRPTPVRQLTASPELAEYVELGRKAKAMNLYLDRIVITGTGLGLPGKSKAVFDSKNADLILDGVNLIDTIEPEYRKKFLDKNVVKLVKASNGQAHFERIEEDSHVVKLAGQMGRFDLHKEYGIEKELVAVLDISTQLAIAGGIEAMRDAGIPLVRKYNRTSTGNYLRGNWELPDEMQEDTAIIFSSTFPGYDKLIEFTSKYYADKYGPRAKRELMNLYASIITRISDESVKREMTDWFADAYSDISADVDETDVYEYNRKFMLAVLSIGHAQFAQFINARGPNLHNNAACATSTQAVGMAEDLLRMGRCKRVILISGDVPTHKHNMEWLVTSLLANGAATTEGNLEEAALPFDRRRQGLIVGMGGIGIVFERAEDVAARGMDPIVELMGTYMANSAYHATRLDTAHAASEMNHFLERLERRYGFERRNLVDDMVFISHETYTPARGGSSNAEKDALEATFGKDFRKILVTNTKGFTGHAFGCGIEDVIAIKILQKGRVPPIANFKVPDPYLEGLNLSTGVEKFFTYALRFAAGFGSQIAMSLTKVVNRNEDRVIDRVQYNKWLVRVSKQKKAGLIVENHTLKVKDDGTRPDHSREVPAAREKEEPLITPPVEQLALPPVPVERPVIGTAPLVGGGDVLERTIIDIISERTGYPADMLEPELDMEADLGIDTVKQVELLGAIREKYGLEAEEGVNLSDYPTIGSVVDYIRGRIPEDELPANPAVPSLAMEPTGVKQVLSYPPSGSEPVPPGPISGGIQATVIAIIADRTGYPADMLEPDLDMEADLGIDTVKQVELFGAIREKYGLSQDEGVNLSDYPTIGSVAEYVSTRLSKEGKTVPAPKTTKEVSSPISGPSIGSSTPEPVSAGPVKGGVEETVIAIIAEKTGYPADMLEAELDMEADLGIDTVKQVELFGAIRERYGLSQDEGVNLSDYPTIGSVAEYISDRLSKEGKAVPAPETTEEVSSPVSGPSAGSSAPEPVSAGPVKGGVEETVIAIIAEKTGYPADMLEAELDMEADLGIDTVKQVELFGAIRERYGLSQDEGVNLSDYPTIGSVAQYISSRLVEEGKGVPAPDTAPVTGEEIGDGDDSSEYPGETPDDEILEGEAGDLRRYLTRYVAAPLSDGTGMDLSGKTVVVVGDGRGAGKRLRIHLEKKKATVIEYRYELNENKKKTAGGRADSHSFDLFDIDAHRDVLTTVHEKYGDVAGVFYLSGLEPEKPLAETNYEDWKELTRMKVKSLFSTAKALIEDLKKGAGDGSFFVSAVEMGGSFGMEGTGKHRTPVQGGVSGLTKALGKEMPNVIIKCVDIGEFTTSAKVSRLLLDEVERGDGRLEVAYLEGERRTAQMYHSPIDRSGNPNIDIDGDWVFIIPGGGFGITAEVAKDLARHFRPRLVLMDIVSMPKNAGELADMDELAMGELKNKLFREMKEGGKRVTPVMLEKEFRKYTMPRTILLNVRDMERLGATVEFHTCDVTDNVRVREIMANVREKYGRIDCIIHAAGIEISKLIGDKPPGQFSFVFDVKANGAYNLFESTREDDVKAYVTFSSVAGRFGNIGQTDYSSANDLLNKYMGLLQREGGGRIKAISTNWTGWRGVGMATRGSLLKIFDDAGVTLIPLDYGKKKVREELLFSGAETEVTVAGKVAFLDADGIILPDGVTPEAREAELRLRRDRKRYPLLDRVIEFVPTRKMIAEKHLDANIDLYLKDHSIEGTPYLPGVMGVEMFAETAELMFPGMTVTAMEDVTFDKPIKLLRGRPLDVRVIGEVMEERGEKAVVAVRVESDFINPRGVKMGDTRIHFTGKVTLANRKKRARRLKKIKIPEKVQVGFEDIYERFFHGPTFRVLDGVLDTGGEVKEGEVSWGRFREPEGRFFEFTDGQNFGSSPMLRECGFQTCGMFDLYHNANMSLPSAIGKVELRSIPTTSGSFYTRIVFKGKRKDGPMEYALYDVEVMDEKGNVVDAMRDYEMIVTEKLEESKRFGKG